jgi:hypothetical protein
MQFHNQKLESSPDDKTDYFNITLITSLPILWQLSQHMPKGKTNKPTTSPQKKKKKKPKKPLPPKYKFEQLSLKILFL